MKAMRLVLVFAFMSFAATTFTQVVSEAQTAKIKISLKDAVTMQSMKTEILQQVCVAELLSEERPGLYFARVKYRNSTYLIFGTRKEWSLLFSLSRLRVSSGSFGIGPAHTN